MDLLVFMSVLFPLLSASGFPNKLLPAISRTPDSQTACSNVDIVHRQGVISSPGYPDSYPTHISCSWHIHGNVGDTITISLDDLDIEESGSCDDPPCCIYNWIKIGPYMNTSERRLCGQNAPYYPILFSTSTKVWIKFHISTFMTGGRGFRLYYMVGPGAGENCNISDMKCANNECVPAAARCNGRTECSDGSDEHLCSNLCLSGRSCHTTFHCYDASQRCDGKADCPDFSDEVDCGFCSSNLTQCGPGSTQCYNPLTQRCNRVLDCTNGEDEKDCVRLCPMTIMCTSGLGCYESKDRCNGVAQCGDSSDEKNCGPDLCNYKSGGFLCSNGLCIREVWKCDRTNDCGDGSDEDSCLRNSVLTAAITGSLICALLLVIAISCMCRLHAMRSLESRLASRETPLSRLSREFFFREPPPSYAASVGPLYVENSHYSRPPRQSRIRRTRRRPRNSNSAGGRRRPSVLDQRPETRQQGSNESAAVIEGTPACTDRAAVGHKNEPLLNNDTIQTPLCTKDTCDQTANLDENKITMEQQSTSQPDTMANELHTPVVEFLDFSEASNCDNDLQPLVV